MTTGSQSLFQTTSGGCQPRSALLQCDTKYSPPRHKRSFSPFYLPLPYNNPQVCAQAPLLCSTPLPAMPLGHPRQQGSPGCLQRHPLRGWLCASFWLPLLLGGQGLLVSLALPRVCPALVITSLLLRPGCTGRAEPLRMPVSTYPGVPTGGPHATPSSQVLAPPTPSHPVPQVVLGAAAP